MTPVHRAIAFALLLCIAPAYAAGPAEAVPVGAAPVEAAPAEAAPVKAGTAVAGEDEVDERKGRVPTGSSLQKLAKKYLEAEESERAELRAEWDRTMAPLADGRDLERLRESLLKVAMKTGRRISTTGTNYFYDKKAKRGKYIAEGKRSKTLFIGLHGGGLGSGDAGSMASGMGGGGWFWIFPEVLEKTERGWTDSGTDRFVLELVEAAKRTVGIDPNRIYITGHSMGGYGSWLLGAHHADVFAGAAAYAGAPTPVYGGSDTVEIIDIVEGVLPNYYNSRLFFFQSLDDPRVPPEPNVFANKKLLELRELHPKGFDFRYDQVERRGHAAPQEGYLPTQKWVASRQRVPRPVKFLWQPVLDWKKHFYWLYWDKPIERSILQAVADRDSNTIEITMLEGSGDIEGLSVLLGEPLVDLSRDVVIRVNQEEKFRGKVERSFSTLMLTLPRNDEHLLFDARVDL